MVSEVETIVRSIEDEKIQKEERDKTRDVFARIEGLDKIKVSWVSIFECLLILKMLALPKPSRVLVEEKLVNPEPLKGDDSPSKMSTPPAVQPRTGVKNKSSFKRLSDVLQPSLITGNSGNFSKKDLWLVVFNDVVLRCQRTGTTTLPIASMTNAPTSRTSSMPELQGKAKFATTSSRRATQAKPRNLYKFIKVKF